MVHFTILNLLATAPSGHYYAVMLLRFGSPRADYALVLLPVPAHNKMSETTLLDRTCKKLRTTKT